MSYCRFGEGDVYIFLSTSNQLECCGCLLQEREFIPDEDALLKFYLKPVGERVQTVFHTTEDMIKHLETHKESGHYVPDFCIEGLLRDKEKNDQIMVENKP